MGCKTREFGGTAEEGEEAVSEFADGSEGYMAAIRDSARVFWYDQNKSKDIIDPSWLDIGVVSVATAYHPDCGRVTFTAVPRDAHGDCGCGLVVSTFCKKLNWKSWGVETPGEAKSTVHAEWSRYCAMRELENRPAVLPPEWLQIKSDIWVCEHNGWVANLYPTYGNMADEYCGRVWKSGNKKEMVILNTGSLQSMKESAIRCMK